MWVPRRLVEQHGEEDRRRPGAREGPCVAPSYLDRPAAGELLAEAVGLHDLPRQTAEVAIVLACAPVSRDDLVVGEAKPFDLVHRDHVLDDREAVLAEVGRYIPHARHDTSPSPQRLRT